MPIDVQGGRFQRGGMSQIVCPWLIGWINATVLYTPKVLIVHYLSIGGRSLSRSSTAILVAFKGFRTLFSVSAAFGIQPPL